MPLSAQSNGVRSSPESVDSTASLDVECRCGTSADLRHDRSSGRRLVALSFGGRFAQPEVPWFVLPSNYQPYAAPGPIDSPYSTPSVTNQSPDNPPTFGTSGFRIHPNITRHWLGGNATFVVVVPQNLPTVTIEDPGTGGEGGGGNGEPDLSLNIVDFFGIAANGIAATYTWQNWVDAVRRTMDKFSLCPTAQTQATFLGVVRGAYGLTEGVPPMVLDRFIWSTLNGGPTGNGVNEIILADQNILGIGLTSMLVDPATGEIVECDVLINVGQTPAAPTNLLQRNFFTGGPSIVGGPVGSTGSGDFAIEGLPALSIMNTQNQATGDPVEYDLVFENSQALGVAVGNQAEWFNEPANPMTGLPTLYNGNSLAAAASNLLSPSMTGLDNDQLALPRPFASSLSVVPGSIIYLTPDNIREQRISQPTFDSVPSTDPTNGGLRFRETTSRPIVSIEPRDSRYPTTKSITITVICDEPNSGYDISTARIFVNGVNVPFPSGTVVSSSPTGIPTTGVVPGPALGMRYSTTWTMTVASLITSVTPQVATNQPLRISFVISAVPPFGGSNIVDLAGMIAVVSGIGRNDVIL